MITLNLIAPEKKQELRLTLLYVFIKNSCLTLLSLSAGVAIVLLLTKLVLQNSFTDLVEQTTLTPGQSQIFSGDIKTFNRLISAVSKVSAGTLNWSEPLSELVPLLPAGVVVDSITFQPTLLEITGLALTRQDLLDFETRMTSWDRVSEVTIPLEQKIKRSNIEFNLRAKFVPEPSNHAPAN